jgi:hypothetical protein
LLQSRPRRETQNQEWFLSIRPGENELICSWMVRNSGIFRLLRIELNIWYFGVLEKIKYFLIGDDVFVDWDGCGDYICRFWDLQDFFYSSLQSAHKGYMLCLKKKKNPACVWL